MNLLTLLQPIIELARPFIPLGAKAAHAGVQRALTIPQRDLDRLTSGMNAEDKAEALRLRNVMADANADFVLFVASRGVIDAD